MRSRFAWVVVGFLGCSKANPTVEPSPTTTTTTPQLAPKPPAKDTVTVQMTAATLADDCGGAAPSSPPSPPSAKSTTSVGKSDQRSKAKRRCEQTSMQLSIVAAGSAAEVHVKKVELLDDARKSLGELTVQSPPTAWSAAKGAYEAWDQKVAAAQELSVSYPLSQPNWEAVPDRWNRTYLLRATFRIGGTDQTVQREVEVSAPTSLPPNVKT